MFDQKSWKPQIVNHKWHTDTVCEIDLVKAPEMGLTSYQIYRYDVVHFGDIPEARIVRHDHTILYDIPAEVTPHAPAIRADVRSSGNRLLDQDQQRKGLISSGVVIISFCNLQAKMSKQKSCISIKKKSAEADERTVEAVQ